MVQSIALPAFAFAQATHCTMAQSEAAETSLVLANQMEAVLCGHTKKLFTVSKQVLGIAAVTIRCCLLLI